MAKSTNPMGPSPDRATLKRLGREAASRATGISTTDLGKGVRTVTGGAGNARKVTGQGTASGKRATSARKK